MKKITTLIIDDESLARAVVREHLSLHPEIEIIGECMNGFEAVKIINEQKPALIFLDIQMPKLTGFEVLELLDHHPAVIFVTAYDTFALKAFDVHAVDYLLKPFSKERFDAALERAQTHIVHKTAQPIETLLSEVKKAHQPIERIVIRDGAKVHVLPVEKIDYIEAQDDYVAFKSEGKMLLKQQRMAELETLLDAKRFVRIHRSSILNIERLARIELLAKESRVAILKDGTQLHISKNGYEKLKEML